jgi:hypothetical protein
MVGQQPLELRIGVRVPTSEPIYNNGLPWTSGDRTVWMDGDSRVKRA